MDVVDVAPTFFAGTIALNSSSWIVHEQQLASRPQQGVVDPPITLTTVIHLADHGIRAESCRFGNLTMESDKYISVRQMADNGTDQVVIVDMHNNCAVTRRPTKAEGTLMNPVDNIMALKEIATGRPGNFIQVFNLQTKDRLGAYQSSERIVFWKWVSRRVLALVCEQDVFHWNLSAALSVPEKVFQRGGKLAATDCQLIAYAANDALTWCLLTGLSTPDQGKTITGHMQLYSIEKQQQQLLDGHAGGFGNVLIDDGDTPSSLFAFTERKPGAEKTKLYIMDISKPPGEGLPSPFRAQGDMVIAAEVPLDFPVALHFAAKQGVLFVATKAGYLFIFDIATAAMLLRTRISTDPIFLSAPTTKPGGCVFVNRKGAVMSVNVNESTLVNYIVNTLIELPSRQDVAFVLARRFGLPGADDLFQQQFDKLFASGDYSGAGHIIEQCKSGALRTPKTLERFKSIPTLAGQPSPVIHYFSALLERGKLNALESVELVRLVAQQRQLELIERWLKQDKLECTEELGDIVYPLDTSCALSVYIRAKAHQKVIGCFVAQGNFDSIVQYVKKAGYHVDYTAVLHNTIAVNPDGAMKFAKALLEGPNKQALIDLNQVVKIFMDHNKLHETTSILLEALKGNKPEQAQLQTQLLAMNLQQDPKVAESILQLNMLSHYDHQYIGQLCEKAGLMQWALEHYKDRADVKRAMLQAHLFPLESLLRLFSRLPPETSLECLYDLMRHNRQNVSIVVQVAIKHHDQIGTLKIVGIFESFGSNEGIVNFLAEVLASSTDPEVHFKYIQAACLCGYTKQVERVCRESTAYDPVKVKDFLKESNLPDPRPLIYVCDLHNFVDELTEYLYSRSLMKYIEVYVTKVSPTKFPVVIGCLIDLDCSEDFIRNLLQCVRAACPLEPLIVAVERRNRLKLLLPWLEARVAEGSQDPCIHNAIAKICVDANRDPENFLRTNAFYDSAVVGKYCEDRNPHLAVAAYIRAWGPCDEQLLEVTNRNGLFRLQARYLVERQSKDLWELALSPNSKYRRSVINEVVGTAWLESTSADEVSATVKAFINADLQCELIVLLEKIIFHKSVDFSKNRVLQNLLMLTAIKNDRTRVMDYINRLQDYDGPDIARIALGNPYNLYEEAFLIYKNFKLSSEAMDVLLADIGSLERAKEFAARCNDSTVWYKLGKAQLASGQVAEAIDSHLRAETATDYALVIEAAKRSGKYVELLQYLLMARSKTKDQLIDTELVYAYTKMERLDGMEQFISGTNTANLQAVGDRLYDEGAYKAATILFKSIANSSKLASCYVHLGEYAQALEAAQRANNSKTWMEVNMACIQAQQFHWAEIAAMHITVNPDLLEELIARYERHGFFKELMSLLERGLSTERSHIGMYTELANLYAKYKPAKLMDFIKLNIAKLNIPRLIKSCERHCLWEHAVYLYTQYDEFDSAASMMMAHSPTAFTHDQFLMVIRKVSKIKLYHLAIQFYLDEQPLLLNSLLEAVMSKLDHACVVEQIRQAGHLPLVLPYLKNAQSHNISLVNEAVNDIYIDGLQYEELRHSIEDFDNFDQMALAQKLERHELVEMHRIAAVIYKKNKRYKQAIELSKQDSMYRDAIEIALASRSREEVESLLKFFVGVDDRECFAACLYTCYDLIRPDVALELAWRNGIMDFAMPFFIQTLRDQKHRLDVLERNVQKKEEAAAKERSALNDYIPDCIVPTMSSALLGLDNLAITVPRLVQLPGAQLRHPGSRAR